MSFPAPVPESGSMLCSELVPEERHGDCIEKQLNSSMSVKQITGLSLLISPPVWIQILETWQIWRSKQTTASLWGCPRLDMFCPRNGLLQESGGVEHWFPIDLLKDAVSDAEMITAQPGSFWIPQRSPSSHKGSQGHLLVVAGPGNDRCGIDVCQSGSTDRFRSGYHCLSSITSISIRFRCLGDAYPPGSRD